MRRQLQRVPLQLGQIVERVGAAQLAGVDQRHEQIAHLRAVQRPVEQRVLPMQHGTLQSPFADIIVERSAAVAAYIGGFSGAANVFTAGSDTLDTKTAFNGAMADPASFAKRVHLLWIGVGTKEPGRMKQGIQKLHAALDAAKIQHVYSESPGTDHEWQTWRRNLEDFAPRLFQPAGQKEITAQRK